MTRQRPTAGRSEARSEAQCVPRPLPLPTRCGAGHSLPDALRASFGNDPAPCVQRQSGSVTQVGLQHGSCHATPPGLRGLPRNGPAPAPTPETLPRTHNTAPLFFVFVFL